MFKKFLWKLLQVLRHIFCGCPQETSTSLDETKED